MQKFYIVWLYSLWNEIYIYPFRAERNFYGYQFLAESRFVNVNLDQITAVR